MKKEDLLKAVGNIDDSLIESAEEKRDSKKLHALKGGCETAAKTKKFNWKALKPIVAVAACFVLVFGLATSTGMFRMGAAQEAFTEDAYYFDNGYGAYDMNAPMAAAPTEAPMLEEGIRNMSLAAGEMKMKDASMQTETERTQKLVYRANLSLQTTNFDKSYEDLKALVDSCNAYFENSSVNNGSMYEVHSYKNGYFCIRVPMDQYQSFMNAIGQGWHVANKDESVSDITEQYYETADRIETLEIKEERLHELLKGAKELGDIITLESELSNTEYELNNYKNSMKHYDKQVDYATINVDMYQVTQVGDTIASEGFGSRLIRSIKNGLTNISEGFADFIVWVGYHLVQIAILIILVLLCRKFHLIRKFLNKFK